MSTHLLQRYKPFGDALYLCVVLHEHTLQHGDSTIDEVYTQSSSSGASLTRFALLFVALARVARL